MPWGWHSQTPRGARSWPLMTELPSLQLPAVLSTSCPSQDEHQSCACTKGGGTGRKLGVAKVLGRIGVIN